MCHQKIVCVAVVLSQETLIISLLQTLGFEKYRRVINSSPQSMQESDFEHETDLEMNLECHGQRSPVNVAIPPTARCPFQRRSNVSRAWGLYCW